VARFSSSIERLVSAPEASRALGAFRLVHPLGKGGFAPVWLAREVYGDTEIRTVAVKLFAVDDAGTRRGGYGASTGKRDRIVEEARALCQVEHPNVVRFHSLYDGGESGVVALIMEYVRGVSLDARLRELEDTGGMPLDELLAVGAAVASALAAVHQAGLVHRDVKPANVVHASGVYKLIDFGIASAERHAPRAPEPAPTIIDDLPLVMSTPTTDPSARSTDAELSLTGTIGYIDPACVATASAATPASDLYALGATLFECVALRVPAAESARRAAAPGLDERVLDGRAPAPSLADVRPECPAELIRLVDALLEADPARRPRSAEAVAWELERIRRAIAGRARPLPPEEVGPFRGLARFEQGDRDVYFGRTVEIAASLEVLRSRGLLAIIGPSGSGKSSLARAGVVPAIADGDLGKWPKAWDVAIATPSVDARASIVLALGPFVDDAASRSPEAIVAALAERVQSSGRGVVLLVDQLEELATVSTGESRVFAVQLLARIGDAPIPGVRAVVAARRDLLDALLGLGELGRALTRGTLLVSPMTDATWVEVLDHALAAYGYVLEDDAMCAELAAQLEATASAMPLVQFALTQLWDRRDRQAKTLPRAALDAIGGIAGALELHAEATIARHAADDPDAEDATRRLMLALTTPQGTRRARDRAVLVGVHALGAAMVERLESKRLLVEDRDGLTIAHEILLTKWTRLRRWIEEAREDRVLAEAIERDASEWSGAKERELLWKGRRLAAALDLARAARTEMSDDARGFVDAARAAARRGRIVLGSVALALFVALAASAIYSRGQTRLKSAALQDSEDRRATADHEHLRAQRALAESLEEQGRLTLSSDPARALVLLGGAYEAGGTSASLRYLLAEAERASDELVAVLEHRGPIEHVALSPGGARVVTASDDGTAKTWDAQTGKLLVSLEGHVGPVLHAVFSADGDHVLTIGRDRTVKIWDSLGGALLASLSDPRIIERAELSRDGRSVLVQSSSGATREWEWSSAAPPRDVDAPRPPVHATPAPSNDAPKSSVPEQLDPLAYGHSDRVTSVARAGNRFVTASRDGTARLWRSKKAGRVLFTIGSPGSRFARFSPCGRFLATSDGVVDARVGSSIGASLAGAARNEGLEPRFSADGERVALANADHVVVVESATGRTLMDARAPKAIRAFALSRDGSRVVTTHADDMLRVWDESGALVATIGPLPASAGEGVHLTPDGAAIVTHTRSASRWDLAAAKMTVRFAATPAAIVSSQLSADGARLVTACSDGAARVWDASSGALVSTLSGHSESLFAATFSPDGRFVATASADKSAKLWDAVTGATVAILRGHTKAIMDVAFSEDGARVVTAGLDGSRIWDAATGRLLAPIGGDWTASARFSPDGTRLVSAGGYASLVVWDVHVETRPQSEVAARIERSKLPWRLVDGVARPAGRR
jgi:WD40 repeat protein/serine/threonine protein kinase/type II secretory pathway predicted ATPase ExeA